MYLIERQVLCHVAVDCGITIWCRIRWLNFYHTLRDITRLSIPSLHFILFLCRETDITSVQCFQWSTIIIHNSRVITKVIFFGRVNSRVVIYVVEPLKDWPQVTNCPTYCPKLHLFCEMCEVRKNRTLTFNIYIKFHIKSQKHSKQNFC